MKQDQFRLVGTGVEGDLLGIVEEFRIEAKHCRQVVACGGTQPQWRQVRERHGLAATEQQADR